MLIAIKNVITSCATFLNEPIIKEGVKNVVGVATFAFGCYQCYDFYQEFKNPSENQEPLTWQETAKKVITIMAKLSFIISGACSRPGQFIISTLVGQLFTDQQLEAAFGLNTIFAINPWHPRHVASLAAFILALPANIQLLYNVGCWLHHQVSVLISDKEELGGKRAFEDQKVQWIAFYNNMTSRPLLHWGNQLSSLVKA